MVIKICRQDQDGLTNWALQRRVLAYSRLADVTCVEGSALLEVTQAQPLRLHIFLFA